MSLAPKASAPPLTANVQGELSIQCRSCGANLVVEAAHKTTRCPYCASSSVVDRPASAQRPVPTFGLGFTLTQAVAQQTVHRWLKGRSPFTRSGVRNAKVEDVRGVYLPAWLYSAVASSRFTASIGEHYWETETYTVIVNGKAQTRTRRVQKTEWRSLSGAHEEYVPDVLVTASGGVPNAELEAVEPFDLRLLHRYTPALVSGWIAEEPSLGPDQGMALGRKEATELTGKRLSGFMPGDTHRELRSDTALQGESVDLCLVPIYVLSVRYKEDAPPFRVLVNGQTGKAHGKAPLSPVKIGLSVLGALLVVLAVILLAGGGGA
jgi:hypothetical protein